MKTIKSKMVFVVLLSVMLLTGVAGASGTLEKVTANLNHGISFVLNGEAWTPKDGNGKKLTPISYQGTTYVPLRAVAEATGTDVQWDSKKNQIVLTSEDALDFGVPYTFHETAVTYAESDQNWSVTSDKSVLSFGEMVYTKAFVMQDISVSRRNVKFKTDEQYKQKVKKVKLAIGVHERPWYVKFTYLNATIRDKDGNPVDSVNVKNNELNFIEFEIPRGQTDFVVALFNDSGQSDVYILWDESTIEFK